MKPFNPKLRNNKLNVVTMVTIPKSAGVSNRARITVAPICTKRDVPDAKTVAPAPRTAARRNPLPVAIEQNLPAASKGFNGLAMCDEDHEPPKAGAPTPFRNRHTGKEMWN